MPRRNRNAYRDDSQRAKAQQARAAVELTRRRVLEQRHERPYNGTRKAA